MSIGREMKPMTERDAYANLKLVTDLSAKPTYTPNGSPLLGLTNVVQTSNESLFSSQKYWHRYHFPTIGRLMYGK